MSGTPEFIEQILICPKCQTKLNKISVDKYSCQCCKVEYSTTETGSLDLRLRSEKKVITEFTLGRDLHIPNHVMSGSLQKNPNPQMDFEHIKTPHHLSKELMSYFPKASDDKSLVLDLGCGDTVHKDVCEYAGFNYVGLDYINPKAPILGDGHALPFFDGSFEFVLMIAVLEHIQYPLLMMQEAERVLKTGGKLIGTVSFLEPFHGNSFYHHTHLGLLNDLAFGGFEVEQLAANKEWLVFDAQARMASWLLFPGLPKCLSNLIIRFPGLLSKLWFGGNRLIRKRPLTENFLPVAGAISFVAKKN